MKAVGSQATPEVIETWAEVYDLFQSFRGERRERLEQVAERLGITFKVARRRLRNYEAMVKAGNADKLPERPEAERAEPAEPSPSAPPRRVFRPSAGSAETSRAAAPSAGASGEFQDRMLTCADCGEDFTWSAGEQAFFRERGLTSEPRRCKPCRAARRASSN